MYLAEFFRPFGVPCTSIPLSGSKNTRSQFASFAALSCAGAAIVPRRFLRDVEDGFRELTADWPSDDGEVKGKLLAEQHFDELCDFLEPRHVLFECSVLDTGTATEEEVAHHRQSQAEGMTVNLTPDHHAELVAEVHRFRDVLERMPLQLYSQFVTLTHVAWRAMEHGMLYFCQRMPGELARFRWIIDSKDRSKVTKDEDWWRVCVKPLLQARSIRQPTAMLKGGDYSAFRRNFPSVPVPDYLRDHLPSDGQTPNNLSAVFRDGVCRLAQARRAPDRGRADQRRPTRALRKSPAGRLAAPAQADDQPSRPRSTVHLAGQRRLRSRQTLRFRRSATDRRPKHVSPAEKVTQRGGDRRLAL